VARDGPLLARALTIREKTQPMTGRRSVLLQQGHPEAQVGTGVVRLQLDECAKGRDGVLQLALLKGALALLEQSRPLSGLRRGHGVLQLRGRRPAG
jgi:hypothetical protein